MPPAGRRAYLDHNATTPPRAEVVEAMTRCLRDAWGNPSSVHPWGEDARLLVERVRRDVARAIGAPAPAGITFTSGGTEADNLALRGLARLARDQRRASRIVTVATEHAAVLDTCRDLADREGFRVDVLPVDGEGRLSPAALADALTKDTALVAVMAANNETGVLQDIPGLAAEARAAGALLFTDAVQCSGRVPVDVRAWGVDAAAFSAHKCGGPKGAGALWLREGLSIGATQTGGGQEGGLRGGTENVAGIVGLGIALRLAVQEQPSAAVAMREAREALWAAARRAYPRATRNSPEDGCLPNTLNVSFPGRDGRQLVADLGREGIALSAASACHSHGHARSHVLVAMGLDDARLDGAVRVSAGPATTADDVAAFEDALRRVLAG